MHFSRLYHLQNTLAFAAQLIPLTLQHAAMLGYYFQAVTYLFVLYTGTYIVDMPMCISG